jgi:hypothetical protein
MLTLPIYLGWTAELTVGGGGGVQVMEITPIFHNSVRL